MRGLLYIPTDRRCLGAIESGARECRAVSAYDERPALMVVEHDEGPHLAEHAAALTRVCEHEGVQAVHVTPARWDEWLTRLLDARSLAADQARLRRLLQPTGVAYSAGPNKAALLAAALGVDVLHRRDSDLQILGPGGDGRAPATLEAAAITKRAEDVHPLVNIGELPEEQRDRRVRFVGSSYWGDPPHDRRDLLAIDPEVVVKLEALSSPGSSLPELREEVENYFVVEPSLKYDDDFYEVDTTGRTELGVACVAGVFRHLPEMPITDTLGCDYFQKNFLYQVGRPVLFHSRKAHHRYGVGGARSADSEAAVSYALRDLRYLLLWRIWARHNRTIRAEPGRFIDVDDRVDAEAYASSLEQARALELPQLPGLPSEFAAIYRDAAAATSGDVARRMEAIAERTDGSGPEILDHVSTGVTDFAWLTRRWSDLVNAAVALGPGSVSQRSA